MATFEDYWEGLVGRNPALRKEFGMVRLDVANIKAIAEQAYGRGRDDCRRDASASSDDLFSTLFGSKRK